MGLYAAAIEYRKRLHREWLYDGMEDTDKTQLYHEVDVLCTVLLLNELPDLADNNRNKYFHHNVSYTVQ